MVGGGAHGSINKSDSFVNTVLSLSSPLLQIVAGRITTSSVNCNRRLIGPPVSRSTLDAIAGVPEDNLAECSHSSGGATGESDEAPPGGTMPWEGQTTPQ